MRLEPAELVAFRLDSALLRGARGHGVERVAALGLQDSAPRSALLSLHARVEAVAPDAWRDPGLVQVWGPRGAIYLVPRADRALFTVGLIPRSVEARQQLAGAAERLRKHLATATPGDPIPDATVETHRAGRLAATVTGQVSLIWDGSAISYRVEDRIEMDVEHARIGLARRFLEVYAPATPRHFARWAGVPISDAVQTFRAMGDETGSLRFRGDERVLLRSQVEALPARAPARGVRLLPPGDPYLCGPDREVIAPDEEVRTALWARAVPPGAVLVDGRFVGTWRRRAGNVSVQLFKSIASHARSRVEEEVSWMPLGTPTTVSWAG